MALFHFHATQIKRSAGLSAIATVAYRAGEKLHSDYYGEDSDYTRKAVLATTRSYCPLMRRRNMLTARPYGMPLKKWNSTPKHSLHTILTVPCRTSFLLMRTPLWQCDFYWSIL